MRIPGHSLFIAILATFGLGTTCGIALHGCDYYLTPLSERPYHPQYDELKPTGYVGHWYGTAGSAMILVGVASYSSRKRLRLLSGVGKSRHFLEVHIFLCLLGALLVVFHTTFKLGGLVAVSFWSMVAVVLSGFVGRYLYVQIPRGIQGNVLSQAELEKERELLGQELIARLGVRADVLERLDELAKPPRPPAQMSLLESFRFLVVNDLARRRRLRHLISELQRTTGRPLPTRRLRFLATRRLLLTRRLVLLEQCRNLFHYWHVIHLPFTVVMFVILAIHVGVAVALGYGVIP
jgi:hypothetical protein